MAAYLEVTLECADNLVCKKEKRIDAYMTVTNGSNIQNTAVMKNSRSPQWNTTLIFNRQGYSLAADDYLKIEVHNAVATKNTLIGGAKVSLVGKRLDYSYPCSVPLFDSTASPAGKLTMSFRLSANPPGATQAGTAPQTRTQPLMTQPANTGNSHGDGRPSVLILVRGVSGLPQISTAQKKHHLPNPFGSSHDNTLDTTDLHCVVQCAGRKFKTLGAQGPTKGSQSYIWSTNNRMMIPLPSPEAPQSERVLVNLRNQKGNFAVAKISFAQLQPGKVQDLKLQMAPIGTLFISLKLYNTAPPAPQQEHDDAACATLSHDLVEVVEPNASVFRGGLAAPGTQDAVPIPCGAGDDELW